MSQAASPPTRRPRSADTGADRSDLCEVRCIEPAKVREAQDRMAPLAAIGALADTFKVLGDPTRLRIVAALADTELCVCDLALALGVSSSVVSHSLRALRHMRLVRYRKVGKIAYYALDDAHIAALLHEGLRHVQEPSDLAADSIRTGARRA